MRGLSRQQLYDLVQEYCKKGCTAGHETSDPRSATYLPFSVSETAAALAGGVFSLSLFFLWMNLIGCLRAGNAACVLENAAYVAGATGVTYIVSLVHPAPHQESASGFDFGGTGVPQDVVGGVDPRYTMLSDLRACAEPSSRGCKSAMANCADAHRTEAA